MAAMSASPIVRLLNEQVHHYHRWCTPSVLPAQERVEDFYASDVSISAGFFGTLVDHTGVFAEAEASEPERTGCARSATISSLSTFAKRLPGRAFTNDP